MNKYERALSNIRNYNADETDFYKLQELVERATPKKVVWKVLKNNKNNMIFPHCPYCDKTASLSKPKHHEYCGQALDWGE
jgi:hypothetical protein